MQGGGIELQVLCLWTEETQDPIVLRQTKKYMCMGYCIVFACIRGEFPRISPRRLYIRRDDVKEGFFFYVSSLGGEAYFRNFTVFLVACEDRIYDS